MSFTFQIQTTSNNQTFGFIADSGTLYIDWGDSQTTTESTPKTGARTHSYTTAGTYNISLTGTATRIAFYGTGATPTLLKDILTKMSDGLTGITSGENMFRGCTKITTFTESAFFDAVSGNVTTLASMFYGAKAFNQPIVNWNTSKVTSMDSMFWAATSFNGDISSWNTSKVTNMKYMFFGATSFNQSLNNWNTSKVTDMQQMFRGATSFNQSLNNWNTSSVTNIEYMFNGATSFNQDISNWNVSSVTNALNLFVGTFLPTVVYDGILIKWSKQTLKPNVTISFGNSKYSQGLPLESKNLIASNFTWTITDGGSTGQTYIDHKKAKIKDRFPKDYVAYYSMDNINENILIDETGNNNGTIYGAVQTEGIKGKALSFDGVDDYVSVADNTVLKPELITLSAWVNISKLNKWNHFINKGDLDHLTGYRFSITDTNQLRFRLRFSDDELVTLFGNEFTPQLNTWYHFVATYDKNKMKLYINGELNNELAETRTIKHRTYPLEIAFNQNPSHGIKGKVDEVMIFNRALSLEEITQIYKRGLSKIKLKLNGNKLSEGLVSYWSMDNVSGNTLIDEKGINNGTIYGATQTDGKVGKALSFDGVDDYVAIPNFIGTPTEFTVSHWIKLSASQKTRTIFCNYDSSGADGWVTGISDVTNNYVKFYLGGEHLYSTFPLSNNVWYHVTVTYSPSNARMYINGALNNNLSKPIVYSGTPGANDIGRLNTGQQYFNGSIDDLMIFNRALSLEEIQRLYNNGLGKYKPFDNKIKIGG